jgi:hypothetical protein
MINHLINNSMNSKIKIYLRWIFLLPLAILFAILMDFPLHYILYSVLSGGENPFITPYPESPELILAPFFRAFVFVLTGTFIAPNNNVIVGKIFSFIWVFSATVGVYILYYISKTKTEYNINFEFTTVDFFAISSGVIGAILPLIIYYKNIQKE